MFTLIFPEISGLRARSCCICSLQLLQSSILSSAVLQEMMMVVNFTRICSSLVSSKIQQCTTAVVSAAVSAVTVLYLGHINQNMQHNTIAPHCYQSPCLPIPPVSKCNQVGQHYGRLQCCENCMELGNGFMVLMFVVFEIIH